MVRATWLSMNLKSRHGLRGRRRRHVVAPGGNRAGVVKSGTESQPIYYQSFRELTPAAVYISVHNS